jgi:hypothetical protein
VFPAINCRNRLSVLLQRLSSQVIPEACVNSCCLRVSMIEHPPDKGETVSSLREPASHRAPQVMNPYVFYPSVRADFLPGLGHVNEVTPSFRAGQDIGIPFLSRQSLQEYYRRSRERDVVSPPGLSLAEPQLTPCKVHIIPPRLQEFFPPHTSTRDRARVPPGRRDSDTAQ